MKRTVSLVLLVVLAALAPLRAASAAEGDAAAPQNLTIAPDTRAGTATITWSPPASSGSTAVTGYELNGIPGGPFDLGPDETLWDVTGLEPGTPYEVSVSAVNSSGAGTPATGSLRIDTWAPTARPGLAVTLAGTLAGTTATLVITPPANPGNAILTGWTIDRTDPGTAPASTSLAPEVTTTTVTGLALGSHTFTVTPTYTADDVAGVQASLTRTVVVPTKPTTPTKPTAPKIGTALSGKAGGAATATARWTPPSSTGGSAVTAYKVLASLVKKGTVVKTRWSADLKPTARSYAFTLPAGTYKFRVVALNKVGTSPSSAYSKVVTAR